MKPLVSISCITYNQAPYIREALDSFLSQKVNFPYEILVHDDCSTDGTAEILRSYEARYRGIFRVMYEEENQYSKGIRNVSGAFNFPRAEGKYIAMCEGDDFWCDDRKLQKQADYLESHPECSFCCHAARIRYEDGAWHSDELILPFEESGELSPEQVISKKTNFPMASLFFRAEYAKPLPPYYYSCPVGDIPLQLAMLEHGTCRYDASVMSVYRAGRPGSWGSDMDAGEEAARKWEAHYEAMEALYRSFSERTQGRYEEACADALRRLRFHTDLKTGRFEAVLDPKNSTWLGELPAKERRLLKLRAKAPGLYGALRRAYGLLQQQGRGV